MSCTLLFISIMDLGSKKIHTYIHYFTYLNPNYKCKTKESIWRWLCSKPIWVIKLQLCLMKESASQKTSNPFHAQYKFFIGIFSKGEKDLDTFHSQNKFSMTISKDWDNAYKPLLIVGFVKTKKKGRKKKSKETILTKIPNLWHLKESFKIQRFLLWKLKKNINLERSSLTKPKNGSAQLPQLQEG